MEPLGIIAGNGEFPLILARSARQLGVARLVAAAFDGETKPEVSDVVDEIEWVKLGQLNKLIEVFTSRGVKRAVMAGGITPSNLFKNLRLDLRMTGVAFRLKERNAETIFGAIAAGDGQGRRRTARSASVPRRCRAEVRHPYAPKALQGTTSGHRISD